LETEENKKKIKGKGGFSILLFDIRFISAYQFPLSFITARSSGSLVLGLDSRGG